MWPRCYNAITFCFPKFPRQFQLDTVFFTFCHLCCSSAQQLHMFHSRVGCISVRGVSEREIPVLFVKKQECFGWKGLYKSSTSELKGRLWREAKRMEIIIIRQSLMREVFGRSTVTFRKCVCLWKQTGLALALSLHAGTCMWGFATREAGRGMADLPCDCSAWTVLRSVSPIS